MSARENFGSGVIWSYLQSWAARGITTLSFLVVGLYLGPTEFGVFSIVASMLALTEMVCEQALSQVVVQLDVADSESLSAVFYIGVGVGVAFTISLFFLADIASSFFAAPGLAPLIKVAALCPIVIGLTAVPIGILRRNMDYKTLARRTVVSSGVSSALGISLVILGYGAWGLVAQAVCYYVIGLGVLWRAGDWYPTGIVGNRKVATALKSASWNAANRLSDFAETRGLELLVGALGGVHALGVFAFASKVSQTAFQTFVSPLLEVVFTDIARHKSSGAVMGSIQKGQLVIATLPSACMLGLMFASGPLLLLLYGQRWVEAALPLAILSAAFFIRGLTYIFGSALLALNAPRAVLLIAAVRALLVILISLMGFFSAFGNDIAPWSYLIASLLVIPISLRLLSKKIGATVRSLAAIPLKTFLAALIAASTYYLTYSYLTLPVLQLASGALSGVVFVCAVIWLNAGLIARTTQTASTSGALPKLLAVLNRAARLCLDAREIIRLRWFATSLSAAIWLRRKSEIQKKYILVVPADTAELDGSLGDQALLLGLAHLCKEDETVLVVSESFRTSHIFKTANVLKHWHGPLSGWNLGKHVSEVKQLYIIGADVMDGYYSPGVSRQRLILAGAFARSGVPCGVVSFSFNEAPSPSVVREFQRLPEQVRICLRDAVSLERFESFVGRKANLVSDLAFLVESIENSTVADRVKPWTTTQRALGRKIVGINVNPQVVAHLTTGSESAIANSVANACNFLINEEVSFVLIPHDFRPGCADLRVMNRVWEGLSDAARGNSLLLDSPFTAQEIKSACKHFDLVFSARMHLAIGALSVQTPVCGMQYQGKFAGLFQHFGLASNLFVSPEDALNPELLAKFLRTHINSSDNLKKAVIAVLPNVKALARLNVLPD